MVANKINTVPFDSNPVHQVPENLLQISLLVGSAYGDGDHESPYGHTAIAVFTTNPEVPVIVYDFGRYGRTYSESLGMGINLTGASSPRGDGILRLWWDFSRYIKGENACGQGTGKTRTTYEYIYYVQPQSVLNIINYFKNLTDNGEKLNNSDIRATYKLKSPYFALGPNCTTLSLDAMRTGLKDITKNSEKYINANKVLGRMLATAMRAKYNEPSYLYLPDNLKDYLDSDDIKIITNKKNFYHAVNQPNLPSNSMKR